MAPGHARGAQREGRPGPVRQPRTPPKGEQGSCPDSNRKPLKLLVQKSIAPAAVKKEWKDQGEREEEEENPRPGDVYIIKGIRKLDTTLGKSGHTEEGCREIEGKKQAGVCFQADKFEFYLQSHAEPMDLSVLESAVMKFPLLEIRRVGHFTWGRCSGTRSQLIQIVAEEPFLPKT